MLMENPTRSQEMREIHHPSPLSSPKGNGNVSLNLNGGGGGLIHNSTTTTNNGGIAMEIPAATPLTPKSISRSEPNPYPTTFVQADTSSFKQVVQILTGSSETVTKQQQQLKQSHPSDPPVSGLPGPPSSSKSTIPPIRTTPKRSQQQQGFKLYERRNHSHLKNSLIINTLIPGLGVAVAGGFSPRNNKPEILSPSMLDFPKLTLSPVTPLVDPFNNSSSGSGSSPSLGSSSSSSSSEEERAIAQKGFYLHPSPMNTPRGTEPQLLPLFPVTSPRVSGASS